MSNYSQMANANRDYVLDEAMKRDDVKALKEQLDKIEAESLQKRINDRADVVAAQIRKKIIELGAKPCV